MEIFSCFRPPADYEALASSPAETVRKTPARSGNASSSEGAAATTSPAVRFRSSVRKTLGQADAALRNADESAGTSALRALKNMQQPKRFSPAEDAAIAGRIDQLQAHLGSLRSTKETALTQPAITDADKAMRQTDEGASIAALRNLVNIKDTQAFGADTTVAIRNRVQRLKSHIAESCQDGNFTKDFAAAKDWANGANLVRVRAAYTTKLEKYSALLKPGAAKNLRESILAERDLDSMIAQASDKHANLDEKLALVGMRSRISKNIPAAWSEEQKSAYLASGVNTPRQNATEEYTKSRPGTTSGSYATGSAAAGLGTSVGTFISDLALTGLF